MSTSNANGAFSIVDQLIAICGQKTMAKTSPWWKRLLYSVYSYTLVTTASIYVISEIIAIHEAFGDISMILALLAMLLTHMVGMGKISMLIFLKGRIQNISNKLLDRQFEYAPLDDFQPGEKLQGEKSFLMLITLFLFGLYNFVGVSAHISSALTLNRNTVDHNFASNTTCKSFIPYKFYFPFDVDTVNGCHYLLGYMDLCLDILAGYIADTIFLILLHLLATQLNILKEALITIRKRCEHKSKLRDMENPALETEMYNEMKRCIKHLYSLIEVSTEMENTYSFITLGQVLASLLIMASCLFTAASVPIGSPIFFSQMEYFIAVICQISMYCWFGNQITLAGLDIPNAIYSSDWYDSSPRFKHSMVMTMIRMKRPLFVSIGKFTPLSLATLLSVIRGSFSYFTLFQKAKNQS